MAKQLPNESSEFDRLNKDFSNEMDRIFKVKNAMIGLLHEGFLGKLTKKDKQLDRIQKSLDQYLETKRRRFPRF
jgi:dynein heavy chain